MPIDIYYIKFSPPSRAVLMTAKHLNIDLNIKVVDLSKGEHWAEDYAKLNPARTVPCIDDNGFILYESRAIMQYLCNKYAPDSNLYPTDPKKRALVDRWLHSDLSFFSQLREVMLKPIFTGIPAPEMSLKAFNDSIKLMDTLIADKKYLVGNNVTIADLSVLSTTSNLAKLGYDFTQYPNLASWRSGLEAELPYYDEVNKFPDGEQEEFFEKMVGFFKPLMTKSE